MTWPPRVRRRHRLCPRVYTQRPRRTEDRAPLSLIIPSSSSPKVLLFFFFFLKDLRSFLVSVDCIYTGAPQPQPRVSVAFYVCGAKSKVKCLWRSE